MEQWLLLTDFASKYRVSVSTLRRRIKAGQQVHKFEAGRYYLPDQVPQIEPVAANEPEPVSVHSDSNEPLITTTSKLLNELKQAYSLILHEKEQQIILLKEEIADLKTLVRVLESENSRITENRDHSDRNFTTKGPVGTA